MNCQRRRRPDIEAERQENKVGRISMDYFFMSSQEEEAKENPFIAIIDEETREKYARMVGRKGIGQEGHLDWRRNDIVEELRSWGHYGGAQGHIILRSDGQSSIKAVRDAVAKMYGVRVIPENTPKGESQSNSRAEQAGKTVRSFARVLKEQLGYEIGV